MPACFSISSVDSELNIYAQITRQRTDLIRPKGTYCRLPCNPLLRIDFFNIYFLRVLFKWHYLISLKISAFDHEIYYKL